MEMIFNLGLTENVIILDYIHHWELAAFYRNADVFVYPSKLETFGIPPLEAMACGCPVITSNYSCIPEIVGDGAEVVETSDHACFAEAIDKVILHKEYRSALIERGRQWCKKYSWEKNAEQMMNEIEHLRS
jgi:glycosyltransferase involved in cell wall biosynthesis